MFRRSTTARRFGYLACAALTLLGLFAFWIYTPTPSSYAKGLELLGEPVRGLYMGQPRAIRSDEWIVYTPYVQIAVANGLETANARPPYHESLHSFVSLPVKDWGLLFKPYHWGFLAIPPAQAYALTYLVHTLAFLVGWAWLFRLLGVRWPLAVAGAFALYWSQFIQVWWTTNAGSFAYAPWVVIAWLAVIAPLWRVVLMTCALVVWIFASGYPPFLYAFGLALVGAILITRRDAITPERLASAAVSLAIAAGLAFLYYGDLIQIMADTVYPGQRRVTGGGVPWLQLSANLLPWVSTQHYEPLNVPALAYSNACDVGVIGTTLALAAACVADWRHRFGTKRDLVSMVLLAAVAALVLAWTTGYLPLSLAEVMALDRVPPNRLQPALGLLITIAALRVLSSSRMLLNGIRLFLVAFLLALPAAYKLLLGIQLTYFDWIAPAMMLAICVARSLHCVSGRSSATLLVLMAAAANLATFGLFNPVQSAEPIFALDAEKVQEYLLSNGARHVDGNLIIANNYGALIQGAGVPSFNHVLLQPEIDVFRQYFPSMNQARFEHTFNRYAHVMFGETVMPRVRQDDLIELPLDMRLGGSDESLVEVLGVTLKRDGEAYLFSVSLKFGEGVHEKAQPVVSSGSDLTPATGSGGVYRLDTRVPADAVSRLADVGLRDHLQFRSKEQAISGEIRIALLSLQSYPRVHDLAATIDRVDAGADGSIRLVGWLPVDDAESLRLLVHADTAVGSVSFERIERPDVARLVDPKFLRSGFSIRIHPNRGTARPNVCLRAETQDGRSVGFAGAAEEYCQWR